MLDVHVLTLQGVPQAWIDQRRASIEEAVANAGYPVVVHEIKGISGHLGRSRKAGYALGVHPYVTHVDHDDYVTPDAFAALATVLAAGVDAVTTGETRLYENGTQVDRPDDRHHLTVYRRELLGPIQYDRLSIFPDQFILSQFTPVHVPCCVYVHRLWTLSASRRQRAARAKEAAAELAIVKNKQLFTAEAMTREQLERATEEELRG